VRAELFWTSVSAIEHGQSNPTLNKVGRLAKALEVRLLELLAGLDSPECPIGVRRRG